jgi:hypothetical protein
MAFPINPVHRLLLEDGTSYLLLEDGTSKLILDESVALDDPLNAATVATQTPTLTFVGTTTTAVNQVYDLQIDTVNTFNSQVTYSTPTKVQEQTIVNAAASPGTGTMPSAFTAGNLVVVAVVWTSSTVNIVSAVSDGVNTYTKILEKNEAGTGVSSQLWYAWNVSPASAMSITFNATANDVSAIIREYSGIQSSADPLDVSVGTTGSSTSPSSGATATTTISNELVVGAFSDGLGATQTYTVGSGYGNLTTIANSGSWDVALEDKNVTATGAQTATLTLGTTVGWAAIVATFKAKSTGGALVDVTSDMNLGFKDEIVPLSDSVLLLEDGTSKLLLEDGTNKLSLNYPYPSGNYASYTVQTPLSAGTYYWRVKNKSGSAGAYRIYSPIQSFTISSVSVALSGTVTTATETDIVTGGKTIILTLTGDTWIAAGAGSFDLQRANIIAGLTSAQSEALGWNNVVKVLQSITGVVRTSNTVVTITLDAFATYNITASETITVTVPATALVGGVALVASPTFTVTPISVSVLGWLAPISKPVVRMVKRQQPNYRIVVPTAPKVSSWIQKVNQPLRLKHKRQQPPSAVTNPFYGVPAVVASDPSNNPTFWIQKVNQPYKYRVKRQQPQPPQPSNPPQASQPPRLSYWVQPTNQIDRRQWRKRQQPPKVVVVMPPGSYRTPLLTSWMKPLSQPPVKRPKKVQQPVQQSGWLRAANTPSASLNFGWLKQSTPVQQPLRRTVKRMQINHYFMVTYPMPSNRVADYTIYLTPLVKPADIQITLVTPATTITMQSRSSLSITTSVTTINIGIVQPATTVTITKPADISLTIVQPATTITIVAPPLTL